MTQNLRITRFGQLANKTKATLCLSAAVAIAAAFPASAISQVVDNGAFENSGGHSILESDNDGDGTPTDVNGLFSNPSTGSSTLSPAPAPVHYDAPNGPVPRMIGARPIANSPGSIENGSDSTGTFSGKNPAATIGNTTVGQPIRRPRSASSSINNLRSEGLNPSPEGSEDAAPSSTRFSSTSTGSFRSQSVSSSPSTTKIVSASAQSAPPAVSSHSSSFEESPFNESADLKSTKYESAYVHDQPSRQPKAIRTAATATPQADNTSSPNATRRLTPPARLRSAPIADGPNTIAQTAFVSPVAPQQFQNNSRFQNGQNGQGETNQGYGQPRQQSFGQQQPQQNRATGRSRGDQSAQRQGNRRAQQNPQTRQRDLPNNQQANQQNNRQANQKNSSNSTVAKQVIAKFSFENNKEAVQGLPIQLSDVLQQSQGYASRTQLTQQYWEVYYDWAQSISASKHHQWIESINSAKQTDAGSLEIAKSNAKNEISFSSIQLGKSQAKMKELTGNAQPIIPLNSPTVTRVKTNYEAFKSRGLVPSKYDGIDETLKQMYELIVARANTAALAEKNATEAKQEYARNQSTVDHVVIAGRTWRSAESDFIGSVIEYNKAYADYALALPYGQGPIETAIAMLIVKPSTKGAGNAQSGDRPNLSNASTSNGSTSNSRTSNTSSQGDTSIPYRNASASSPSGPSASSATSQRSNGVNNLQRNNRSADNRPSGNRPSGNRAIESQLNLRRARSADQSNLIETQTRTQTVLATTQAK